MTNYSGYMGRVVWLELGSGEARDYPWSDADREKYIGGKAMASKVMYDNFSGDEDPLGPDNLFIVSTGPLTGSFLPSTSRFDISGLSPQTGITASSNCGGDFGLYLKKAGIDALIIHGRCENPAWIVIDDGEFRFMDASKLWGLRVSPAQREMERLFNETKGKKNRCGMICIGPAGENLVRYASVISGERAAGRTGLGAVLGSKNIKGILAAGSREIPVFDREKTTALTKKWTAEIRKHPFLGKAMPRMGTAGMVSTMHARGLLATGNFSAGSFDNFEKVSGERLAEEENIVNSGCLSCPIRCSRTVMVNGQKVKGPELETLGLMGPNLLNDDLKAICRWNYELDELGMDTISCGGTLAWAMEANEKGLWDNGLHFGQTDGMEKLFEDIAFRRGIGAELAEGSKRLSEKYGGKDFAIQSKGLELSAYQPRRAVGQGLGYAVSNRGGCHLNGGYLVITEGLGLAADGNTPKGKADMCMLFQDLMDAVSACGQCLFTAYSAFPPFLIENPGSAAARAVNWMLPRLGWGVRLLNKFPEAVFFKLPIVYYPYELEYVTGMKVSMGKFLKIGERSFNVERAVNARFGVSAERDKLPKRLTDVRQYPDDPRSVVPLEQMKRIYYSARGWGEKGIPDDKKLRKLGIK